MLIDANSVPSGSAFACDLCVVGAGPAGIAIVNRLRESGLSIVLLESGGTDPEIATQRLARGENHGHGYFPLETCRYRLFGGGVNRWGGWCRPLDGTDFERRDWIPWSGWPIAERVLESYYADTAALFELADPRFDLAAWQDRLPAAFSLEETNFENIVFQFSSVTDLVGTFGARLFAAANITTLLHANLTRMELSPNSSRVESLRVAALGGRSFTIAPKAVVLAAGGIENARLLLASRDNRSCGLGNELDLVGRFFMEHLHVPSGHLFATASAGDRRFYRHARYDGTPLRGVIVPTAAAREHHRLPSTSIAVEAPHYAFGTRYLGWSPQLTYGPIRLYRKLRSGRLRSAVESLKGNLELASGLPQRYRNWNLARAARIVAGRESNGARGRIYPLYFRAEQLPDPASRVTLSERRDPLGIPQARLEWRVNRADVDAILRWLDVLDRDVRALGLGRIIHPAPGWQRAIIGGPHHMGTTRMSADPRHGVVDEHCRVHSVDNLYVAGSSVFATGGYANPTFTLVALALRLADKLRDRLRDHYFVRTNP